MPSSTETYRSRLQDQVAARRYAERFERGARRRINEREQRAVRRIFSSLGGCLSVLDVPCGAGRFLQVLSADGRQVTGMDMAAEVLPFARERAQDLGVNATFLQGDASGTGLPDQSVDAVFCNRLLHHITTAEERAVFLRELHRVTRRHLVVSFFDYRQFGRLRVWLKRLKGRRVDYWGQPTLAEFGAEVARCGFRIREVVPTGPPWVAEKYLVLEKI